MKLEPLNFMDAIRQIEFSIEKVNPEGLAGFALPFCPARGRITKKKKVSMLKII